jgi:hypothetical protein
MSEPHSSAHPRFHAESVEHENHFGLGDCSETSAMRFFDSPAMELVGLFAIADLSNGCRTDVADVYVRSRELNASAERPKW